MDSEAGVRAASSLDSAETRALGTRFRTALVLRMAITGAVVVMLVVTTALALGGALVKSGGGGDVLALPAALLGLASVVAAYALPRYIRVAQNPGASAEEPGSPAAERQLAALTQRSIVQGALAEVPGILGLALAFVGASPLVYLPFFAVSLAVLAATIPRKSEWEQEITGAIRSSVVQGGQS